MDAPGASWMNKRAEEEYQRALEYVVDQEFNLGMLLIYVLPWSLWYGLGWDMLISGHVDEFGDPFDERDVEERLF